MLPRAAAILMLATCAAAAAEDDSPAAKMNQVAANQLGILEYCQVHGLAGAEAVAAERAAIAGAPQPVRSTVRAETLGQQGLLEAPDGERETFAQLAHAQGTTVPALCKDLADSALEFQAAIRRQAERVARTTH